MTCGLWMDFLFLENLSYIRYLYNQLKKYI